ncbi:MAG TPA: CBS domain-containing protein [Clostridia bacterium]|jgi:acetoin utilization protein AcuB|nr:CBS domain-containing protein [Clostridia bacterium]
MIVKMRMTPNPITVDKDVNILDALKLMQDNQIRRLPVMDNGRLVGIVTDRDLREVSPSPASTLSIFELNYLLSKTKIKDIMTKNVITISPDALIEEAASLMREHTIGGLPVVDDNGKLVGIITETNIFDVFMEIMGINTPSTRLTIYVENKIGSLAGITQIIKEQNLDIISLITYTATGNQERGNVVIRVGTTEPENLIAAMEEAGYKIVNWVVTK